MVDIYFDRYEYTACGDIIFYAGEFNGAKFFAIYMFLSKAITPFEKLNTKSYAKTYKNNHWSKKTHTYHKHLM
jgi:hypothetical protein